MKLILLAIACIGAIALPLNITVNNASSDALSKTDFIVTNTLELPKKDTTADLLKINKKLPKSVNLKTNIKLESRNMVLFRGVVTSRSIAQLQQKIMVMSNKLSKDTPIYLVLDTPGGSVFAGSAGIEFIQNIPQKVHTVTLFAASMGFQIVQNLDKRYIVSNGTLMSHRASLGGLGGQLDGELESQYKMIKRKVDYMELIASKRMKLSVPVYKKLIKDEYWVHGFDAVSENAADEEINASCGKSLEGKHIQEVRTLFGPVYVTYSDCPLIQGPLKIEFPKKLDLFSKNRLSEAFDILHANPRQFLSDYIQTGKYKEIFID